MTPDNLHPAYKALITQISTTYVSGRKKALQQAHTAMLESYWAIGQHIVEFEQHGHAKAAYGSNLLQRLSNDLVSQHGKGFSRVNLNQMRQFYLRYPDPQSLSPALTYSHYVELSSISDDLERSFYEQQTIQEQWGLRELKRQKKSSLFLRLAASRDKEGILALARQGQTANQPEEILRDPYVFEFLKVPEPYRVSEADLETRLIDNLQSFLLELGKGFAFIGRQYRITINNRHYKVDLVFYHRILKCFVLIDLKRNAVQHEDIGQMNMYLGYFASEENVEGDNPPIGIVLASEKDELLVKFATYGMNSQLFVAKYQMYLPNRDELQERLKAILDEEHGD